MVSFLSSFGLSFNQLPLIMLGALLIGANKTGLVSISLIAIPIFAAAFGGRASAGIVLPILVIADATAVLSFRKGINWKKNLGLWPWAFCGIIAALFVGNIVSDKVYKAYIICIILIVLTFLIYKEITGKNIKIQSRWYTNAFIGILGGFSTMIGNAAGPIMAAYFLSIGLNKNEFVATRAWFFWLLNLVKLPLHIFVWKTVTFESFCFDLVLAPAIVTGGLLGFFLVKRLPEKPYRIFVIIATFVSSVFLII